MIKVKGIKQAIRKVEKQTKAEVQLKKTILLHKLVNDLKAATPVDTGRAQDGWEVQNGNIRNDVPYIEHLNQGSSQQAPAHFIESTILANPGVKPNGIIVTSVD